ncbi:CRISPR-associated helicase Cas3' [Streptomyces sp. NPDC004647]|uniref:CRISPR-associated helicase Cas3' n=1 Tax=Streptomyces sp. NPDC004647 TaxID=3154671 RepID=UPI0033A05ED6
MMKQENVLITALMAWGKTDTKGNSRARGGPSWNPLLAHLLDVAAVTGALWNRYLPPTVQDRLAAAFGGGDHGTARRMVMFLAAVHDLGKASDCFLRQFGTGRFATPYLRKERSVWETHARATGLPLGTNLEAAWWARHEHITAAHLPRLLGCTCEDCGGTGPVHNGLHTTAHLLGGHHGHIPQKDTVDRAAGAASHHTWEPTHRVLIEEVARHIGIDLLQVPELVQPERPSSLTLFTGLVVLADWIASDETQFPYRQPTDSPRTWWHRSQHNAQAALTKLKLDRWKPQPVTWDELWPGTQPRDFQAAAISLMPERGPALVIVESDTGSGKTRLALWCAHYLARTCGYQGLYMAMPTRAATNQIAEELSSFIDAALGEQQQAPLAVVHGTAAATDIVHRLLDAARPAGPELDDLAAFVTGTNSTECSDQTPQRAVLDPWYLRRCLGLIATFGIGTVDQMILAAQKSRHWFLRMFGLACKTVIIDEAHAYELYQQDLLTAAVSWLADAGASVVVLSATLPAAVREALTKAWCRGHRTTLNDTGDLGPITVVDGRGHARRGGPTAPPEALRTKMDFQPDTGPATLAAGLLAEGRNGGCLGVVRTRVASACDLYEQAQAQAAAAGWRSDEIILLHGRMMPRDRLPIEDDLIRFLGLGQDRSKPNPDRPGRLLVIATQVIEQSLDLDFDRLYTDLAPIDLLIQRRGREHRHALNHPHRPSPFADARMTVWWKPSPDGLPLVEPPDHHNGRHTGNPDGYVYAPYTLAATWNTLTHRSDKNGIVHLSTPRDSTPLIEAVYGPHSPADSPADKLLNRTRTAWQNTLAEEHQQAERRGVHPYSERRGTPIGVHELADGRAHGDGDEGGTEGIAALSRLGEPSVNAITLYQQNNGTLTYDPAGNHRADLADRSNHSTPAHTARFRAQQRDLLLNTLSLPATWFQGRVALPDPEKWPRFNHPPLRNARVIILTPNGTCVSGPTEHITYSPVTGLAKL